jgi:hypothetical protein
MTVKFEDVYPGSRAFLELPCLRIPSGWQIGWNTLSSDLESADVPDAMLFSATSTGTRFNIEVSGWPGRDAAGTFHLTVTYAPWPRTDRGRRIKDQPLTFLDGEVVHEFSTGSYARLIDELQHWIARCSVWIREGS